MYFIHADGGSLLNYEAQVKSLSGMDDVNKKLLQKFFPTGENKTLFDRISCQFAMHYFLKDMLSWTNFKTNIKNHLRNGGYFIATTFDANEVIKLFKDDDKFTIFYDDEEGNKKRLFEALAG